jgi:hypothetical protein
MKARIEYFLKNPGTWDMEIPSVFDRELWAFPKEGL